jgi:histidinol-phosphate aminotransferase
MKKQTDEKNVSTKENENKNLDREKIDQLIRLSQNENPLGASPHVLKAITDNYKSVHRYPAFTPIILENKLSQKYGVPTDSVLFAAGSSEIVNMIIQTLDDPESNIVTSEISFIAYRLFAKAHNRECRLAKMTNYTLNLENMLSECDNKTKVIFIANPNNPTGTFVSHQELYEFIKQLPKNILVVVDEAYAEYVTDETYPDSFGLMKEFPNLIVLRTFSKIYGLAGLRIGYAIGDKETLKIIKRVKIPYSVNILAYPAALAALEDAEYIDKCSKFNAREREKLYLELNGIGFNAVRTQSNFLFLPFGKSSEKNNMYNCLLQNNLLVRKVEGKGKVYALRISIGTKKQNDKIIECFKNEK